MKYKFFFIGTLIMFLSLNSIAQTTDLKSEANKMSAEAAAFFKEGKYEEAVSLAIRAIEYFKQDAGKESISLAVPYRNLAYIQLARKKNDQAKEAFKSSVELYEKVEDLSLQMSKSYADSLEKLADLAALDGKTFAVEKYLVKAISIREKAEGADSVNLASPLAKLAAFKNVTDKQTEAFELYLRAYRLLQLVPNKRESDLLTEVTENTNCLAIALNRSGEFETLKAETVQKSNKEQKVSESEKSIPKYIYGDVLNGKATSLPKPSYPMEARTSRTGGSVSVRIIVDHAGKVVFACVVSGPAVLRKGVEAAALQATFLPSTLSGNPVMVIGTLTYNFVP